MYQVLLWGTGKIAAECEENGLNAEIIGFGLFYFVKK